ncbi:hypothetical protein BH23BAC3_BH23BAC3_25950 [soil metagenome]
MNKETKEKIHIAKAGAHLYKKNPYFSMSALAAATVTDIDIIYKHFPNRISVLEYFYESILIEYQEITQKIEGYMEFTLSEKLSNLALTLIDLMAEHKEFVSQTYRRLIVCTSREQAFNEAFKVQLKMIYENDPNQSSLSSALNIEMLYKAGLTNFHILIKFWLHDKSPANQKTMELVDKWTSFVQEVHYTAVLDKGFEFAKFLFYNSPLNPSGKTSNYNKN